MCLRANRDSRRIQITEANTCTEQCLVGEGCVEEAICVIAAWAAVTVVMQVN